jgi:hypothetical protein
MCHSNEWIPVGEQPPLDNLNALESRLWKFLHSNSTLKFEEKDSYRFQYKYIDKSTVLINALCLATSDSVGAPGSYPGPTSEALKKAMYEVLDGGSCFFKVKYSTESESFGALQVNGEG